jgi:dynein heavy chain
LLFSFLLSSRILEFKGDLSNEYWRFLLTGGISVSDDYPKLP